MHYLTSRLRLSGMSVTLLSLTAAVLTAACFGPQLYRAFAVRTGVSVSAWVQSFGLGLTWAVYGLATQQWVLLTSEALFALGSLGIVSRLLTARHTAITTATCAVAVLSAFAAVGPGTCLVAASLASITVRIAQIRRVVQARTAAGVSITTWSMWTAANIAWTASGVARADAFFACSAGLGSLPSFAVVTTCIWARRLPASVPHKGPVAD